jgi:hypothetical protein
MSAAHQRAGSDERPRGIVLAEIGLVHVVEFRVQRDGGENLSVSSAVLSRPQTAGVLSFR